MTPRKLKCQYILDAIFILEQEKEELIIKLQENTPDDETIKILVKLKKTDASINKLRKLATKLVCEID